MILENPTMCPDSSVLFFYSMYNKDILLAGVKSVDRGLLTNIVIYKATSNFLCFSMDLKKKHRIDIRLVYAWCDIVTKCFYVKG